MDPMPKAYGITGGIGTGKSTVSAHFRSLGVPVIDADEVNAQLCQPGQPAFLVIKEAFGEGILSQDGTLSQKKLAAVVFSDSSKRKELEQITHPLIREAIRGQIRAYFDQGKSLILVEAALMMESGFDQEFNGTIVVICRHEQQIERVQKRSGLSVEEIEGRISAQWPLEKKKKKATFVIDNSCSIEEMQKQVESVFQKIKSKKERKLPLWH